MRTLELPNRQQWLAARQSMIGASESAAVFGVGYADQSPLTVWESKVHPLAAEDDDKRLRIGRLMEPALRSIFTEEAGLFCESPGEFTIFRSDKLPWLGATLDGVCDDDGETVPVELKNVDGWQRDEWAGDEAPLKYQVQVQHQLAVTGATHGYLFGLVGGNDPHVRRIERNDRFIEAMLAKLTEFWRYVELKEPPPADASAGTAAALARLYPKDTGAVIDLPEEAAEWAAKLAEAKAAKKEAEAIERECSNLIRAAIKDASYGRLPDGGGFSLKAQDRAGYYVEPSSYRVLRSVKKVPSQQVQK